MSLHPGSGISRSKKAHPHPLRRPPMSSKGRVLEQGHVTPKDANERCRREPCGKRINFPLLHSRFYFQTSHFPPQNCSADFANMLGYISRIMCSSCKLRSQLSIRFHFPNRKTDYYPVPTQCWVDSDRFRVRMENSYSARVFSKAVELWLHDCSLYACLCV